jgi:2-keto-3-deoxy-L-rhamnonate aldolase RhmA
VRYPPAGSRSLSGLQPHFGYQAIPAGELMRRADALTLLIGIIETAEGIERIDEIAAVPGMDALQIGTNDLSVSLGVPGEVDHPRVQEAVGRAIAACRRHGKIPVLGGAYREEVLRRFAEMGIRMMLVGNDLSLLVGALRARAAFVGELP